MPIQNPGRGGAAARCGQGGYQGARGLRRRPIFQSTTFRGAFSVSGVTRDSAGAALGNCVVELFLAGSNTQLGVTTSDGSGNYSFTIGTNQAVFLRAYKSGAPDLAGTTVNTIQPAAL